MCRLYTRTVRVWAPIAGDQATSPTPVTDHPCGATRLVRVKNEADVIVVGAGPGGAAAARYLAALIKDGAFREAQREGFAAIRDVMTTTRPAGEIAAETVAGLLRD